MEERRASEAGSFESRIAEHRLLDQGFGRFVAAASAGDAGQALEAIEAFDGEMRRHMEHEERDVYRGAGDGKLISRPGEDETARLAREMRLEHVQLRELSAMVCRLLAEKRDLLGALRLAANLARRWDSHTTREEREVFRSGS